ncbi:type II secretion system F family protein [Rhabdothermincola sp.]|uniref:type II secretion system F family protein n=1 Tax=Rhabdothermincola sp. TaxID=2820405 RepID=UPI002FE2F75E
MTTLVMVILGAGIGAGVLLCIRALTPRPVPIDSLLAGLDRPGRAVTEPIGPSEAASDHLGRVARRTLEAAGLNLGANRHDFELVDRTTERHALDKLMGGVAGLLVPNLAALALTTMGIGPPLGLVAVLSLGTAALGFLMPDFLLRDEAEKRRRAFRHALSSYLDLVNVLLAGGAGIETALYAAADAGDGWGYQTIRGALRRARLTGQSPWDTFAVLADDLGINELAELAANVSLAGSHGARIRASLAAKADTLRGHQVAETEAAAEAATERMTIPVAVLLLGFLLFIAYPAVSQITSISGPQP